MRNQPFRFVSLALLAFILVAALPATSLAQEWSWGVTPYIWAPGAGLDVDVRDVNLISGRASLKDLADNVDFISSLQVEAHKENFGFLLGVDYMNLGGHKERAPFDVRVDLKQTFVEGAGVWTPGGGDGGFGILFGARVLDIAQKLDLAGPVSAGPANRHYSTSPTLLDGMLGFRYLASIGERGSFNVRGDYSAGGTESTLNGVAGFGYAFGDAGRYTLLAGYRYMDIQFKEKDRNAEVESELTLDGPYFGFRFAF